MVHRIVAGTLLPAWILLALPAAAQELPAPAFQPGDRWVYRETDLLTKREIGRSTETVFADATGLWLQQSRGAARTWWRLDAKTATLLEQFEVGGETPAQRGRSVATNDGGCAFPWPLKAGARWECSENAVFPNGWKLRYDLKYAVEGVESVQTEAGRFDALRLVAKGYFTNTTTNTNGGHERLFWLAPDTRRELKSEIRTLLRNGQPFRVEGRELVEFKAGG